MSVERHRIGFRFQVRADKLEEYEKAHGSVWPEMLEALHRHGWHNYSIFLDRDGMLFGYFETAGSFEEALAGMESEEVNTRWQETMAPFFDGVRPDQSMRQLREIFHLD